MPRNQIVIRMQRKALALVNIAPTSNEKCARR